MWLQHINSEVPGLYLSQEAFQFQEASPEGTGQVSQESRLLQVQLFPLPSAESDRHKQKEAHTEDTCKLNSTIPISSSWFDGFCSLTGSHSEVTELHPSSITLTPWVFVPLDNGDLHLKKVGACWLCSIPAQASTFQDNW